MDSACAVITRGFMDVTLDITASQIWRLSASEAVRQKSNHEKTISARRGSARYFRQVDVDTVIAVLNLKSAPDPDSCGIIHKR